MIKQFLKGKAIAGALMFFLLHRSRFRTRLDESCSHSHLGGEDRVESPCVSSGVAVSSAVISSIDTNGDRQPLQHGTIRLRAAGSQRAIALHRWPAAEASTCLRNSHGLRKCEEGVGEIHIEYTAMSAWWSRRNSVLENHNRAQRAVYLVNALVFQRSCIPHRGAERNAVQSAYELNYTQEGSASAWAGQVVEKHGGRDERARLPSLFHFACITSMRGQTIFSSCLCSSCLRPWEWLLLGWTGVTEVAQQSAAHSEDCDRLLSGIRSRWISGLWVRPLTERPVEGC